MRAVDGGQEGHPRLGHEQQHVCGRVDSDLADEQRSTDNPGDIFC